jgi:hypothetical protein
MSYDPSIFNISPYYDDFDANNRFLRVMFKPGYAVQARELTQIQSILQDQISKMGDHLFKDGSRIVGASITVRNTNFLGLKTGTGTPFAAFASDDWKSLVGGTVYYGATASATIAHVLPPETDDKLFVVLDYVNGYASQVHTTGVTVGITTGTGVGYSPFVVAGATYNGLCKLVTVGEGIFYVDGAFVLNTEQSFAPYSVANNERNLSGTVGGVTFSALDKKVGFAITRDTVTSSEDATLLDPSYGSPNYRAPGADRYVINLDLAQVGLTETPDDFVELLRLEDGKVTQKIDKVVYGDLAKTLAQRTYDESGSYVVKPFDVSVRETSPVSENLNVVIGPGKAYVFGTEVETKYPTIIGISKGRLLQTGVSSSFVFNTGNSIGVSLDKTNYGSTAYTNLNTLNGGSAVVKFRNSSNAVIGEAKVHGLIPNLGTGKTGFQYSMYLYGVCSGSVIAGASTAAVYGFVGGTGYTWGVFTPSNGVTFPAITGSGVNDTCLVYEIAPTQGISAFTALTFYGKIVSKTLIPGYNATGVTYTVANSSAGLDLPTASISSAISLVDGLSTTPSTTTLSQYSLISQTGTTAMALSPANCTGAGVYSIGSSVVIGISTSADLTGFTSANSVRMVLPYKYTADFTSTTCRTKTSTSNIISNAAYTLKKINGRIGITLPHWDVYSVSAISAATTTNQANNDALADFELDDGQREGFYDYAALVVKKSKEQAASPGSNNFTYAENISFVLSTTYKYLAHAGNAFGPFVGQHSYISSGISYDQIPLFTNPRTGRTVSLANCVDFRHSGPTADTIVSKPYGDYQSMTVSSATWTNFLPRMDRLSLKINPSDASTTFAIDTGASELSPQSPPESENSMTIATLLVPAYTHRANDVVVTKNDVRRYTMSDISSVEKRIDDVEVFSKLTFSEREIDAKQIKPLVDSYVVNGGTAITFASEPIKTSIYADDFYGHAGGDVGDTDHRCSVDYEYGELRSLFVHTPLRLDNAGTQTLSTAVVSADGLLTLPYSTTTHVDGSGYNKTITVNPTGTVNWLGFMQLSKQYETQFETGIRPVVYNNNMLENDNWIGSNANDTRGFGTQWNDWEYLWMGSQIRTDQPDDIQKRILETPKSNSPSSIPTINSGNEKTTVNRSTVATNQRIGNMLSASRLIGRTRHKTEDNHIIDRTVVPYVPVTTVGVTAYGLRPNSTGLGLYVDGTLVKSGISTDSNGSVGVTFAFTSGGFLAGEKSIRITDNSSTQNATQAVDGVFYCGGNIRQRIDGVYSTRNPEYRRQTVTSEGIIKDPFNREVSYDNITDTLSNNRWIDPLCQTFIVDAKATPEGIFANSVNLYFEAKDTSLPVTVQLRPTINGYPSPSVSFPFSTVTKMPAAVSTGLVGDTTTPVATGFTFSSPVYLPPGEYAIAVLTNSKNYTLRANDSGVNLTNIGRGNNPLVGTLYQPQSVGAAVQNLGTDIAFAVNRCEFNQSSGFMSYPSLPITNCQVLQVAVPQIVPTNCTSSIVLDSTLSLPNGQNKYLSSVYLGAKEIKFNIGKPSNSYISPAVDAGLFFGIGANMITTDGTSPASPTTSYVSKAVTLPEELVSTGVFATAEVVCPYGSKVEAYVRWSDRGESDMLGKAWTAMSAVGGIGSPLYPFTASANLSKTELDFRPTQWEWLNTTGSTVRAYQIKLVYTTTTSGATKTYAALPCVRSLRMCSFRTI